MSLTNKIQIRHGLLQSREIQLHFRMRTTSQKQKKALKLICNNVFTFYLHMRICMAQTFQPYLLMVHCDQHTV